MSAPDAARFRANNELALHVPRPGSGGLVLRASARAAVRHLQAAGCSLVPIGPHSPDGFYLQDPSGVVFDLIQRDAVE